MLIFLLYIFFFVKHVCCTIDVNLAEFNYLANHLSKNECKLLVAALHFKNVLNQNAIYEAEHKVPNDKSCLSLLLHWNSTKGEGLGQTHEHLRKCLITVGRRDLADWLGITVFKELGTELEKKLEKSRNNKIGSKTDNLDSNLPAVSLPKANREWTILDTLYTSGVAVLLLATIVMLAIFCYKKIIKKRYQSKAIKKGYNEVKQMNSGSESESEDKFDIRRHKNKGHCDYVCGKFNQ